ncbi:NADPH:quinone reductase [Nannocystis exedens]|uniref:NADPH:quinone reductase n=1 Tax=Nannocystis exedens TaxID=54 RepID=A0A1I1VX32_9BACT|nr:NAD(P)-dependent alcohol dehydrogenase [Nannocystis exedens]PCC72938.1 NADPH:quinone reductase [Nannocystis exedens]SFD87656.1 NADPH:quinone reductase [Nannocystis exedens]
MTTTIGASASIHLHTAVQAAPATMRAVVQRAYGGPEVLRLEEARRPAPGAGEVLVRVRAASVCKGDAHLLTGKPYLLRLMFGLRRPALGVAGQEVAGVVEATGPGVTALAPGDAVFGQVKQGFAEYVCAPADRLAAMPRGASFAEAAALPVSGMTALQGLRDAGELQAGQRALIVGASGGVGTMAVQIAKALGAEVTAVCSTRHGEKVRSIGADQVIDYTREDWAARPEQYDVVLDLIGDRPLAACRSRLTPTGVYVASAGAGGEWFGPMFRLAAMAIRNAFPGPRMTSLMAAPRQADLQFLASLVEAGTLRPVIERQYSLAETPAALGHVAAGHTQGKVVIAV